MSLRSIATATGLSILGLAMLYAAIRPDPPLDAGALAQRAAEAAPRWENYDEDMKGMMGAGPVARWRGKPVEAVQAGRELQVVFAIRGDWTGVEAALPIIVEDATGEQHVVTRAEGAGARRVYRATLSHDESQPWVVVRYPGHEMRLPLNRAGHWATQE